MKIIQKHILKEFLRLLAITVIAMLALFLVVEVVEKADDLLEKGMPLSTGVTYFLYKIPSLFSLTVPVSVLLAVLISLGLLNKNSEITAIKAGGVSLMKMVSPLIVCGLFISLIVIGLNEVVIPHTERATAAMEAKWLSGSGKMHVGRAGTWLRTKRHIFNIRKISKDRQTLEGVSVYRLGKGFKLKEQMTAKSAVWKDGRWSANSPYVWTFSDKGVRVKNKKDNGDNLLKNLAPPDSLLGAERGYEAMSFTELGEYIKDLRRDGYDTTVQLVELYTKFTFPLVNLIMVLVGIPFALKSGRKGGIASGVAISFIIAIGFWVVFGLSKSLGQTGVVPPIFAAVFPDMLFLAIGVVMFGYVKQ